MTDLWGGDTADTEAEGFLIRPLAQCLREAACAILIRSLRLISTSRLKATDKLGCPREARTAYLQALALVQQGQNSIF
jgi:hypothetical protein